MREAGITPAIGQPSRYYGRRHDLALRGYPAVDAPCEFEADSDDGRKCARACREGSLWPSNAATASYCGVPYVPVEFNDGTWSQKPATTPKSGNKQ